MDGTLALFLVLCIAVPAMVSGGPQSSAESPILYNAAEAISKQIMNAIAGESGKSYSKRANEEGEDNEEDSQRPELHFSTLRAQASGSAIPSPTMVVGGFSFMLMPTPEGEQVFSKFMEGISNLAPNQSGRK